jgi:hypothetical protein
MNGFDEGVGRPLLETKSDFFTTLRVAVDEKLAEYMDWIDNFTTFRHCRILGKLENFHLVD